MKPTTRETYRLVLRPEPAGPDKHGREPIYRLKVALKRLLRDTGLRCIDYRVTAENRHRTHSGASLEPDRPLTLLEKTNANGLEP